MSKSAIDRHYYDSNNWKLGFIYFCRADQRIFVPKLLGWTLNFARPFALPFLGFYIAVAFGTVELVCSFDGGGDLRFAVKLLLALGLIALCYRLTMSRLGSAPSDNAAAGKRR
jgi:hypothetical protein